jgi:integrin alpha FG-GAP repeat containing protein 1
MNLVESSDLFLTCQKDAQKYFEIWVNSKDDGFVLGISSDLPEGAGQISFADIGLREMFSLSALA